MVLNGPLARDLVTPLFSSAVRKFLLFETVSVLFRSPSLTLFSRLRSSPGLPPVPCSVLLEVLPVTLYFIDCRCLYLFVTLSMNFLALLPPPSSFSSPLVSHLTDGDDLTCFSFFLFPRLSCPVSHEFCLNLTSHLLSTPLFPNLSCLL